MVILKRECTESTDDGKSVLKRLARGWPPIKGMKWPDDEFDEGVPSEGAANRFVERPCGPTVERWRRTRERLCRNTGAELEEPSDPGREVQAARGEPQPHDGRPRADRWTQ